MRNLKKVLSLALCLVMLLGMMVVGAGAADFKDASTIQYDVAAAVLDEINVINGYEDDSFRPTEKLTRAQGAAIVYRLIMGGIDKDPEPVSTGFVDVDGNADVAWATGYIAACAQQGILSGVGGNKFEPAGELSGYAFAKMLLVALGYDAGSQGYTGTGWEANVLRDAYVRGITVDNVSVAGDITREQAAQMALQTLTATMVDQTPGVSVNGVVIPGSKATDRVAPAGAGYDNVNDSKLQFCELYFPGLTLRPGTADAFGRATKAWKNGVKEIASIPAPAFVTYTKDMDNTAGKNQIKSDLAGYLASASAVAITENGTPDTALDIHTNVDALAAKTGNGKVVEVYVNDTTVTSVVTTEYQIAEITSKSTISKAIRLGSVLVTDKNDNKDYYDTLDAMEKGDRVIVALKGDKILEMSEPEVVSGAYTKKSGSKYTVGGTEYEASENKDVTALNTVTGGNFDLYLDKYGYVLLAEAQTGADPTNAFILFTSRDGTPKTGYTHSAQLLKLDGTVEWVEVSKYNDEDLSTNTTESSKFSGNSLNSRFTKFVVNEDGLYELDAVADYATAGNQKGYVGNIDPDVPNVTTASISGGGITAAAVTATANSKTVFLVKQADGSYKSYTGIKNVPKIVNNTSGYTLVESTIAKVVIVGEADKETSSEAKYVYFYNSTPTSIVKVGNDTVYTYKAIVDGVDTTVETVIRSGDLTLGLYANYSVDGNGYIKSLPADDMDLDGTIANSKLGKTGNIGVRYNGLALTLKVTSNILTVTAKADADIVVATDAEHTQTANGNDSSKKFSKYAADNFTVYRVVEGAEGEAEVLEASAETLSVADTVIITLNADGEAAVAYVMGDTALPHVHNFVEKQGVTVKAATCTEDGQEALYICDAEGCDEEAGTTWTRSGVSGSYTYTKGDGVLDATGHTPIADPSTDKANSYVHGWNSTSSIKTHAVKCSVCGQAAGAAADCSDGNDNSGACTTCGQTSLTTDPS